MLSLPSVEGIAANGGKQGQARTRRSPGRPRVYANAAERQRAYRARLAAQGLALVRRIERVAPAQLKSAIIDLSECRGHWRTYRGT